MWELLGPIKEDSSFEGYSERLKVPGGWIVRTIARTFHVVHTSQTFVADEAHTWSLKKEGDRK